MCVSILREVSGHELETFSRGSALQSVMFMAATPSGPRMTFYSKHYLKLDKYFKTVGSRAFKISFSRNGIQVS